MPNTEELEQKYYTKVTHKSHALNHLAESTIPFGLGVSHRELVYIEYETKDGKFFSPSTKGVSKEDILSGIDKLNAEGGAFETFLVAAPPNSRTEPPNVAGTKRLDYYLILEAYVYAHNNGTRTIQVPPNEGYIISVKVKTCKIKKYLEFTLLDELSNQQTKDLPELTPETLLLLKEGVYNAFMINRKELSEARDFAMLNGYPSRQIDELLRALSDEVGQIKADLGYALV